MQSTEKPTRILRRPAVVQRVGLSVAQIDNMEAAGRFPKRVVLSPRAIGWVESEIEAWLQGRVAASRAPDAPKPKSKPFGGRKRTAPQPGA